MTERPDSSVKAEPYGFWPSDYSAAQVAAASRDFGELRISRHGVFWAEYRPEDARSALWHWQEDKGQARCLTPQGFSVRSRVYEYGGGAFCPADNGLVFVNESDQQLYYQPLDGSTPQALTACDTRRYGDLHVTAQSDAVLAVEESHEADTVIHRLVSIRITDGERTLLAEGADFYASPVLRADDQRLAWIEWDRPYQPWVSTRLMAMTRGSDGHWLTAQCIAGGPNESLQQPRFDDQGRLTCLSDRGGWWQPWREVENSLHPIPSAAADHASAQWQLGASTYLMLENDSLLATWLEEGFGLLATLTPQGEARRLASDFTHFRQLTMDNHTIYCIAASPTCPSAVLAIDCISGELRLLAGGQAPLDDKQISQPYPIRYPTGSVQAIKDHSTTEEAYGFFYPPAGKAAKDSEKPPLVVFIHGGPTAARYPVFDPRIQFWTQRGFAIADLNYRGSSGYGRAYRESLHERWGIVDVEDACAAVTYLAGQDLIDPTRAFIRGGSAGGFTTLCALAFHDVFCAGASLYGVSDPIALGQATHKFEGDYLDWLIGDPEKEIERYKARTPLLHADMINVPVIFFQGALDAVVVPQQTETMVAALKRHEIPVEYYSYPGERHGFRQAANLAHALEHEWRFYQRWL
ncbi:alpha/beta hydrolase family protein [Phytohalomonas tamaricis]|uniref:alpha/beta hydrolase family protein n=1 Tax=Phytohalomonas tamaricis TaxID=2081032 RepID=UPI000D0B6B1F|nr:S9 family peptidase [Phytohalomonas tamaricis]